MSGSLINLAVLGLFVVGGGLAAVAIVIAQRSGKGDERSEHWAVYPSAKGYPPETVPLKGEPGRYTVVLDDGGRKPIRVIKEVRAITGLSLMPAKVLVDEVPSTVLSGVDHATAAAAHVKLTEVGASVRIAEA